MAASINRAVIIGNLGADPDIRQSQVGSFCNLRVATTDTWRDKQTGERQSRTEWHNVVIFDEHLVKTAQQYLKKGARIYVEGKLETRKWQDKSAGEHQTTEIVLRPYQGQMMMLDGRLNGADQPSENRTSLPQRAQNSGQPPAKKYPGRQSHFDPSDEDALEGDVVPW